MENGANLSCDILTNVYNLYYRNGKIVPVDSDLCINLTKNNIIYPRSVNDKNHVIYNVTPDANRHLQTLGEMRFLVNELNDRLTIMDAFMRGRSVEMKRIGFSTTWDDKDDDWDWTEFTYRIKQTSPTEVLKIVSTGVLVSQNKQDWCNPTITVVDGMVLFVIKGLSYTSDVVYYKNPKTNIVQRF
jgi:hypothetical protein